MAARGYGAFAVGIILLCLALAILGFGAAALGGFNSRAVVFYVALFASAAASFYLLANRRELSPKSLRRVAAVVIVALLIALSPAFLGLYVLLKGG